MHYNEWRVSKKKAKNINKQKQKLFYFEEDKC